MKVLLLVYGELGVRVSGPEIRGLALARSLAQRHEVTVAIGDGTGDLGDRIRVVPAARRHIAREALRHDAFLAPSIPPYVFALKALWPLLAVSDQYDPVELEVGTLESAEGKAGVRAARGARQLQVDHADVILCANRAQRDLLAREIERAARNGDSPEVAVVPFGLPEPPEPSRRTPIRDRFPEIGDDRIVLWWGSVWRWLDAESAIRAVADLDGARLVITAGRQPNAAADNLSALEPARELAASLGLLGERVLFLEDWIPFDERHHYLQEADLGFTLHKGTPEAPLAARARYMDYLWTGLPCVLGRGDELAARFGEAGFARLVEPGDVAGATSALRELLADPAALAAAGAAAPGLAASLGWEAATEPLERLLAAATPARAGHSLGLLRDVGGEYLRLGREAIA